MSWIPGLEPGCPDDIGMDSIETMIVPRARDLGSPKGVDVRPHPHIGLATVI